MWNGSRGASVSSVKKPTVRTGRWKNDSAATHEVGKAVWKKMPGKWESQLRAFSCGWCHGVDFTAKSRACICLKLSEGKRHYLSLVDNLVDPGVQFSCWAVIFGPAFVKCHMENKGDEFRQQHKFTWKDVGFRSSAGLFSLCTEYI